MSDVSIKEGLSYFFGEKVGDEKISDEKLFYILTSKIVSSINQPRKTFSKEALDELAASIKEHGILQPILVRKKEDHYEIVAGERRYRAAAMAGLENIPCMVEDISDEVASVYALIENIQRKDLNIIEEADAFNRLIELYGLSHEEASQYVGKSRSYITNTMRLLKLTDKVKKLICENIIQMGQGRALLMLPEDQQIEAADMIVSMDLNTRQTEILVKKMLSSMLDFRKEFLKPVFLEDYSSRLTNHLDSKFKISQSGDKYKVYGVFESEYDFKKFLSMLGLA